jgi:prepilin-type N-terminal cleavage/methylation domain-containing protein
MKLRHSRQNSRGFTLTELMIAVCILGLVSAIAIPQFVRAKVRGTNAAFVANVKQAASAFDLYAWEKRGYPGNSSPGVPPPGMDDYLLHLHWSAKTPVGGQWNWDKNRFGYKAGIGVYQPTAPETQFEIIDEMIDDGDLSTGYFRSRPDGYVFILDL